MKETANCGGLFAELSVSFAFGLFFIFPVALPLAFNLAGASMKFLLVLAVHVVGALTALMSPPALATFVFPGIGQGWAR